MFKQDWPLRTKNFCNDKNFNYNQHLLPISELCPKEKAKKQNAQSDASKWVFVYWAKGNAKKGENKVLSFINAWSTTS